MRRFVKYSATLCNVSMLLYILWLMLPAVQAGLKAVTGCAFIALFGVGVIIDGETIPSRWYSFIPRILFAVLLPIVLYVYLQRGKDNLLAYMVQQGMFWFPMIWCAYARQRADARLYRAVFPVLVAIFTVTLLTTAYWLIEAKINNVISYSRTLAQGVDQQAALRKELMLRNIGGFDFIYAAMLALPIVFYLVISRRGWIRAGFIALYLGIVAVTIISELTYATLFCMAITFILLLSFGIRLLFKRIPLGISMLCSVPIFLLALIFHIPVLNFVRDVFDSLKLYVMRDNIIELIQTLSGEPVANEISCRMTYYSEAVNGFLESPLFGTIFGHTAIIGKHSELFDMLSGLGIFGTVAFCTAVWIIGRGSHKGVTKLSTFPYLVIQWFFLAMQLVTNTVFYSREISLIVCMSALFLWLDDRKVLCSNNEDWNNITFLDTNG